MKGWLVVNEFLQNQKFSELTKLFLSAAQKANLSLTVYTNAELLADTKEILKQRPDFVLFWDKDIVLGNYLESQGIPLYNSVDAIRLCDDKRLTHIALMREGIPSPRTIMAPMTYPNIGFTNHDFFKQVERELSYPFVVKEAFGSFGEQVYLVRDRKELQQRIQGTSTTELLFQEYIPESRGRDVRLQVVGDRVVASMYRYSDTDFRANVTAGGKMKNYTPSKEESSLALRAARAVGADFAGVDLLFGAEGPLVCEVNSNAHFKNIQTCTGVPVAEEIIQYLCEVQK
ncbi:MAG: RimK family alpha-L-glutamate ligase [Eubacterium sp.]|nr:RimK family alpha-L-glutamate ligase [Eubacterium sp.]